MVWHASGELSRAQTMAFVPLHVLKLVERGNALVLVHPPLSGREQILHGENTFYIQNARTLVHHPFSDLNTLYIDRTQSIYRKCLSSFIPTVSQVLNTFSYILEYRRTCTHAHTHTHTHTHTGAYRRSHLNSKAAREQEEKLLNDFTRFTWKWAFKP